MYSEKELEELAAVDIRSVDIDSLVDLRDIRIDTNMSVEKRVGSFINQSKNPYIHRIGDYVVKVTFQKDGASLEERMEEYLNHLTEIYICT